MPKVDHIEIRKLKVPLKTPYKLAFGTLYAFDTLVVIVRDEDNRVGFGEATLLPGYTDESIDEGYTLAASLAETLVGQSLTALTSALKLVKAGAPFTATAFLTALDMLQAHPSLFVEARVPLLAIISNDGKNLSELTSEIDKLIGEGYRTLKFKVGFNLESDLQAVRNVQQAVDSRAKIRIDANQGYSLSQATEFLVNLDPQGIELVEQTCDKTDWHAAIEARKAATVPLMLDESIYGIGDITRAKKEDAADYVKLKLMKLGNLDMLADALDLIGQKGMTPVLGNGVATDIGCWMEACVAAKCIKNAGEMNGFLKAEIPLLDPPLICEGADIVLTGDMPGLNYQNLESVTVQSNQYSALSK